MSDGVVGTAVTGRFRTSAAGESFTITNATKPDGSAWGGPSITDLGVGNFEVSFTPDVPLVWEATLTGDTSGEVFDGSWDIGTAAVTETSMTDAVRTTTLEELIRRVAFRLGDAVFLESTDAGSTTTFIDTLNIPQGNEDLTRRQLVFTSGTYRGQVKTIQTTQQSAHLVVFDPAAAGNIPAGVTALVINKRGMGYNYAEYKQAINMAQDDAYPIYRELGIVAAGTFDASSPTLALSAAAIDEVYAVQWQDDDGAWWPIDRADHMAYPGWEVNRYSNQITINDANLGASLDGYTVRILGEGRPAPMSVYSDSTRIHPEWLVSRSCYHLCLMGLDRDITGLRGKQVLTFQAEAENRMTLIRTRREPSSERTRSS